MKWCLGDVLAVFADKAVIAYAEAKAPAEAKTKAEARAAADAKAANTAAEATKSAPAQSPPRANTATPADKTTAEAKAAGVTLQLNDGASLQSVTPGLIDSLRGTAGLAADISSIKQVLGGAVALAAHSKVTQQQLNDKSIIQGRPELLLFYGAVCQGLQCMLHIATAFKTGSVQLDKNSSVGGHLGQVSNHYNDAVDAVSKAGSCASDLAARAGSFEGAANAVASVLDKVAEIADGIPVASFVLKGLSFIVNQVQGLKFDARMNCLIKSLFPDLSPLAWTYVVEEVARRVTVVCAADIQALHSGTEDSRGRVKNWFRSKCSEYGLVTLTSKAEDAVVMMALQKVDCVAQLALSDSVPKGLGEHDLADFIVRHVVPSAPAPAPALPPAASSVPSSAAPPGRSSPPPPAALHDVASHDEVEQLRKKLEEQAALNKKLAQAQAEQEEREKKLAQAQAEQEEREKKREQAQAEQEEREKKREQAQAEQEEREKKREQAQAEQEEREKKREQELAALRKQIQKLVPQDKEKDETGSGGGLVLASSKSEVNAETVNTAAVQAVRPVQQQQIRMEHQLQELTDIMTDFIASHSDPVLKSHLEDLTIAAVPVMKKHNDVLGWQDRFVAVRRGTWFYGDSYKAVKAISDGRTLPSTTDRHIINLSGCSVDKCPDETDKSHYAFVLTTAQVYAACVMSWMCLLWVFTRRRDERDAEAH
jgi:hypothetical protein